MVFSAIKISNLQLDVFLGVYPEEQKSKQKVSLDIEIRFQTPPSGCETDNIADTFCYEDLNKYLQKELSNQRFNLIEKLSLYIYTLIKKKDITNEVLIKITKNQIPLNNIEKVSFIYSDFRV